MLFTTYLNQDMAARIRGFLAAALSAWQTSLRLQSSSWMLSAPNAMFARSMLHEDENATTGDENASSDFN